MWAREDIEKESKKLRRIIWRENKRIKGEGEQKNIKQTESTKSAKE
jgi:hypothetical protein